jgi:hypothetical protein
MKYLIMSAVALTFAVSSVHAQARPGKAKRQKKQMGKHPNGKPVSAVAFPGSKHLVA